MFLICASLHPRINLNALHIILHSQPSSPLQAIIPAEQPCSSVNKFPNDAFIGCSMHQKHIFLLKKFRSERSVRAKNLQSVLEDGVYSSEQPEEMEFLVPRCQCQLLSWVDGYSDYQQHCNQTLTILSGTAVAGQGPGAHCAPASFSKGKASLTLICKVTSRKKELL